MAARCRAAAANSPSLARVASLAVVAAFAGFAVLSVVLTVIDIRTHRLPDAWVLPSYPVGLALLGIAALADQDGGRLLRAVIGMVALFAFYLVLRIARPAGMGGGDVKLAGVIGLLLGWQGWGALVAGTLAAFVLGGIVAVALIAVRRADAKTPIPFGPFMIAGAWVGVVTGHLLLPGA